MVQETTLMNIFLILSIFVGSAFSSTLAQVQTDITGILTSAASFDKAIQAFNKAITNASVEEALTIHFQASDLNSSLNQLTTDLKSLPLPLSEDDVIGLLDNITGYVPIITDALVGLIEKQSIFMSLPVAGFPGLVSEDLVSLNSSNSNLEMTILATFPGLNCHTTAVDSAFANAIAAYSN
uniref:Uncharacterized protein n=1 Tax=Psilocybe cubensis TaxID=181762 RepID=A0A8H7XWW7_PSICU